MRTAEPSLVIITLSEIRQRQILHNLTYTWNLTKQNIQQQRLDWWLPGAGGWYKQGDVDKRVQTITQKMSKFWEPNVQHSDYS